MQEKHTEISTLGEFGLINGIRELLYFWYELLFTLSDEEYAELEKLTHDVTIIGRVTDKSKGIELVRESGEHGALPFGGWDHFKR